MRCSSCGERIAPGDARCPVCGATAPGPLSGPLPPEIRRCPRCRYAGEGIGYFRRPGNAVLLVGVSLLTWGLGGFVYWLLRRRRQVCPRCGLTWFDERPALAAGGSGSPASSSDRPPKGALPSAGTGRRVLGVVLALVAMLLVGLGLVELEAISIVVGSVLGAAGAGSFAWGWRSLQERRAALRHALERRVLHLATVRGGTLTATEVASHLDLSLTAAEGVLIGMDDGFRVRSEVTDEGVLVFEFPELRHRRISEG